VAVSLIKIANDIRFLGSGPRLGYGELKLPATQPGSSIMPGKVNPVMAEMLMQVGGQVMGNDAAITFGGALGNFELNAMMPLIAHNLLQSIELLTTGVTVFTRRCIQGIEANVEKCQVDIERSLAMCTPLAPVIGYDRAAQIAKRALETNRTVREVSREHDLYATPMMPNELGIDNKIAMLVDADRAARAYNEHIRQVQASYIDETKQILIVTSEGRFVWDVQPMVRMNVMCIAEENGNRQAGYQGGGGRRTHDVFTRDLDPKAIAQEAARQAILQPICHARCGSRSIARTTWLKMRSTARCAPAGDSTCRHPSPC
jgi:hypothetical protein